MTPQVGGLGPYFVLYLSAGGSMRLILVLTVVGNFLACSAFALTNKCEDPDLRKAFEYVQKRKATAESFAKDEKSARIKELVEGVRGEASKRIFSIYRQLDQEEQSVSLNKNDSEGEKSQKRREIYAFEVALSDRLLDDLAQRCDVLHKSVDDATRSNSRPAKSNPKAIDAMKSAPTQPAAKARSAGAASAKK